MNETSKCPRCGAALSPDAPEGLCPRCLMALNLATPTEASAAGIAPAGAPAPKPPAPPPAPGNIAQHFPHLEILECLGRGGMGVVYRARQPRLDRFVALKILAPEKEKERAFAERFAREAQALARLNHPNIVTVHDFGEAGGFYYLLMEYVDGVSLRQLLRAGKMTPEQALAIVPKICEALQFAHEQGIVHRDIKPENILLDKQGRVKIADFGIAKLVGQEGDQRVLTGDQQVLGTPHYMAPEQVEHPLTVDHRADIYSLGVVFYEMLTRELPLGRFAPPSQKVRVDVRLDEVVLHALEKEPARRYQHASQVKSDVETIATSAVQLGAASASSRVSPPASISGLGTVARFSRLAIVGASWAPFALVALAGMFTAHAVVVQGNEPPGPTWFQAILAAILLPLGVTAPFGTTILGAIALSQIRGAPGRLCGLGLALADTLLFPLLALDALIGGLWYLLIQWVASQFTEPGEPSFTAVLCLTLVSAGIADFFIARQAWRAAQQPPAGPTTGSSDSGKGEPPEPDALQIESAQRAVKGPALALLGLCVSCWIMLPLTVLLITQGAARPHFWAFDKNASGLIMSLPSPTALHPPGLAWSPQTVSWGVVLFLFGLGALLFWAAWQMRRLEAYGIAVAASALAILATPVNFAGLPIGIWSWAVLARAEVWQVFRSRSPGRVAPLLYCTWFSAAALVVALGVRAEVAGLSSVFYPGLNRAVPGTPTDVTRRPARIDRRVPDARIVSATSGVMAAQLRQAETAVVRLTQLRDSKLVSQAEFDEAKDKVEELRAELERNPVGAARARLATAQRRFIRLSELADAKLVSAAELESATSEMEMRQAELVTAQADPAPWKFFGPVVERELNDPAWTKPHSCLDLDTGVAFSPGTPRLKGVDLASHSNSRSVQVFDLLLVPVPGKQFQARTPVVASELIRRVSAAAESMTTLTATNLPATFCFKTREGGLGLLQITDFSEDLHTVKLRYRLASPRATNNNSQ